MISIDAEDFVTFSRSEQARQRDGCESLGDLAMIVFADKRPERKASGYRLRILASRLWRSSMISAFPEAMFFVSVGSV